MLHWWRLRRRVDIRHGLDSSPESFTDSPRLTDGGDCLTLGTLLPDFLYDSKLETLVKRDLGQRTLGRNLGGIPGGMGYGTKPSKHGSLTLSIFVNVSLVTNCINDAIRPNTHLYWTDLYHIRVHVPGYRTVSNGQCENRPAYLEIVLHTWTKSLTVYDNMNRMQQHSCPDQSSNKF